MYKKILLGSLISAISISSVQAQTKQEKLDSYILKKTAELNHKIKKDMRKQKKMFYRIAQEELKADSYDNNIDSYEKTIDCVENSKTKKEVRSCYLNLKEELLKNKELLKNNIAKQIKEDSENSSDMFYAIGADVSKLNWKKYSFKYITVDMEDTDIKTINELHNNGKFVICYINAGSYEDWRSDADSFSDNVKGKDMNGWEGEKWIDIRDQSILSIMKKRMNVAKNKKCDGVDFDNIDEYTNDSGFNLTKEDQINYNISLAEYAHELDFKVSLKNSLSLIEDLSAYYDFAVNEQCNEYNECNLYNDWLNSDKPVFNIEYRNIKNSKLFKGNSFHTYLMNIDLNGKKYIKK